MRFAFLADSLDNQYGGIHVYTKELLQALAKVDQQNEYIVVRSEVGEKMGGFEELVIPFKNIPGYRAYRLFVELPKILNKKGVDLVIDPAHFGPFNLPSNIKRITVIHDLTMFLFPQYHVFWSQFIQRKMLPGILKKADHIITNSENTTKDLHRIFPFMKNKTSKILLGKNELFRPAKDETILQKYNIQTPYLLYLGTLEPRKNLIALIGAFNAFKRKTNLPHQLILVGKRGWKSKPIFEAIEASPVKDQIRHLGYVAQEDLPVIYSMATVFVYPSHYEGFGLPVLEAMACGTPVITTAESSLPEVGGEAAIYVSSGSSEMLCRELMKICSDEELNLSLRQKSLEQAAHFSWEKTAKETLSVFEKVVGGE